MVVILTRESWGERAGEPSDGKVEGAATEGSGVIDRSGVSIICALDHLSKIRQFVDDAWMPDADKGAEAVRQRTDGRAAERVMVAAPSALAQQAALIMAARESRVV